MATASGTAAVAAGSTACAGLRQFIVARPSSLLRVASAVSPSPRPLPPAHAVAAPAPPRWTTTEVVEAHQLELLDARDVATFSFDQYRSATQDLANLRSTTAELEQFLAIMEAEGDALQQQAAVPSPATVTEDVEARRAKRAAKRATRRATDTLQPAVAAAASAPAVLAPPSSAAPHLSATSTSTASSRSSSGGASSSGAATWHTGAATGEAELLESFFALGGAAPSQGTSAGGASSSTGSGGRVLKPKVVPRRLSPATATAAPAAPAASSQQADPWSSTQWLVPGEEQATGRNTGASQEVKVSSTSGAAGGSAAPTAVEAATAWPHARPHPSASTSTVTVAAPAPATSTAADDAPSSTTSWRAGTAAAPPPQQQGSRQRGLGAVREGQTSFPQAGTSVRTAAPSGLGLFGSEEDDAGAAEGNDELRARQLRRAARTARPQQRGKRAGGSDPSLETSAKKSSPDSMVSFMRGASKDTLLNADSEKQYATLCKDLLFLNRTKAQCKQALGREPTMDEWARAAGMQDLNQFQMRLALGEQAKELMLKHNYRLVVAVCKKYAHTGTPMSDLVTEGINGLMRGIDKFDASKGFRFSTYAHWWIRQAITRSLATQSRIIRLPTHMAEQLSKLKQARQLLTSQNGGREPTLQELSAATGLSVVRIKDCYEAAQLPMSLEAPAPDDDDGSMTMMDALEDGRNTPEGELRADTLKRDMESILRKLPDREAEVIRMRFGLLNNEEATLEEVGARFKITRERVRQIEKKAMSRLVALRGTVSAELQEYSECGFGADLEMAGRESMGMRKT